MSFDLDHYFVPEYDHNEEPEEEYEENEDDETDDESDDETDDETDDEEGVSNLFEEKVLTTPEEVNSIFDFLGLHQIRFKPENCNQRTQNSLESEEKEDPKERLEKNKERYFFIIVFKKK